MFKRSHQDINIIPVKTLRSDTINDVEHAPRTMSMSEYSEEEKVCKLKMKLCVMADALQ